MPETRMEIANFAQIEIRGRNYVSFDVAMNGHVISTVDAPLLSGRILWSHAAIQGFGEVEFGERTMLEAEIDRALGGHGPRAADDAVSH